MFNKFNEVISIKINFRQATKKIEGSKYNISALTVTNWEARTMFPG
jgi:hypothetical protein